MLYNKDLDNLYSSPNIMMIESRRMRCEEHVVRKEERRNVQSFDKKIERNEPNSKARRVCNEFV